MILKKELIIDTIIAQRVMNSPFTLVFQGGFDGIMDIADVCKKWPSIVLDDASCSRFGIPMSLDIIGRTVECTAETVSPPISDNRSVFIDLVGIRSLEEIKWVTPCAGEPPMATENMSRIVHLETYGGHGDAPCPYYRVGLPLTAEEFEKLKAELSEIRMCKLSFALKS